MSDPARFLNLDDRVGALRPGLDGDVVIWSGNPLDVVSRVRQVFVDGRSVFAADPPAAAPAIDPAPREDD